MESQSETTQTMPALKLPILKSRDYDLWSMRMEQYLNHADYALWEVIVNGDAPAVASASVEGPISLKTFHGIKDAKTLWEAIKARFQKLISQLEIHGEVISQEDANLKLLRSLPLASNNIVLIMRNKSDLDTLCMDDLYNNLKVYEAEIKGQSSSVSNSQNVAFISLENTSSTNEAVNTARDISTASSQGQASSSTYADDVVFSFFANQSNSPQLDNEDLEQIDTDDLEEIDLKWAPRNQGNRNGDAPRRIVPVETPANALVVQDGIGYQMGLESLEARIVVHEKNKAVYEEDIAFLNAKDKAGLGYDSQINKNEVVHSVFNSRESDVDDTPVNDRFKTGKGFHAVPPPYTGNYMPSRPDLSFARLDDYVYKTKVSKNETSISKTSKDIVEKPKTIRPSTPIIEYWDTDSDNDSVFRPKSDQTKPKFNKINFVKSDENVKSVNKENTHRQVEYPKKSQSPRDNRRNWNGLMTQKLGNGFKSIKKACFVCGSFNHLIKDCDFHDKKMIEKPVLNNKGRVTAVVTKSGQVPVNTAKQSSPRAAASISTVRPVNTVAPKSKVNDALPKIYSYFKAHSPVRRAFHQKSAAKTNNLNEKVKTSRVNNVTIAGPKAVVSATVGNGEMLLSPQHAGFGDQQEMQTQVSNGLDPLGKFDGKADEGFFVGYSINRKAFRVFNTRTRKVEETMHVTFLENKPNVTGSGPNWLFNIDLLTNSMNYEPVTAGNQTNKNAGIKDNVDANQQMRVKEMVKIKKEELQKENDQNVQDFRAELDNLLVQQKEGYANSTNRYSTISLYVSTNGQSFTNADDLPTDSLMPDLEDTADLLNTGIFSGAYDDEGVGTGADLNNLETTMNVSPILIIRIHKNHPKDQIIEDLNSATQTRRMTKIFEELAMTLVDLPKGKRAIGTKWVYRNKKDERGIIVRNKARLVAQGYTQEEGIDYDKVFAPVARIEALRLVLAYASFMGFIMYQMDVKNAFLYGSIEEEVYVCQPPGFEDLQFPDKVYKVMQRDDGIFISQDKYVTDILKKFDFVTMKAASTLIKTNKALNKDEEAEDVDVHLYRSMIGSLMYLTASRPDIMFAICACARFQDTPKTSHLHAVKKIFRYLKGQSKLGLWYPRDSPFDLEAFSDSDYAGASLDRKSTTGGCQFLGKRLISWQCKKQTIVANSTTEVEYVAATNCCGQVLWIQNQMLDYGFNFMNTKIYIDNESTICIVKNPVFHSKTKHIEIRHHFIRDSYEKKLIQVIKIHTDHNVADLLTKAFDVSSDEFGVKTGSCKVNAARQDLVLLGKMRSDLHSNDEDGITCLSNDEIFVNLALIRSMLVPQVVEGEGSGQPSEPQPPSPTTPPSQVTTVATQHQKTHKPRRAKRGQDTKIPQSSGPPKKVGDEAVYTREDDRVVGAATTASSLEAEQESGNIHKTRPTTTLNEPSPQGLGSGSGPRHQDTTLGGADAHTRFETASKKSHDPPLSEGNTSGSGEDNCSRLGDPKAKKESKNIRKGTKGKNSRDEALQDCDFDVLDDAIENVEGGSTTEQITTARDTLNTDSINVSIVVPSNISAVGPSTSTAGDIFKDEMTTIDDTLVAIRSARPRTISVMIRNVEEEPKRATPVPTVQSQDKGKGKMVEPEPTPKNPRKAQIHMDEELAQRLFEEEQA
ncbi:putative ribonuclease H-like domain-containing protein [Tanacetum coccineum]